MNKHISKVWRLVILRLVSLFGVDKYSNVGWQGVAITSGSIWRVMAGLLAIGDGQLYGDGIKRDLLLTLDTISSGMSKSLEVWLRGDWLTRGLSVSTEYWQSSGEGVGEDVEGGWMWVPVASFSASLLAFSGVNFLAAQNAFSDSGELKLEPRCPIFGGGVRAQEASSDLVGWVTLEAYFNKVLIRFDIVIKHIT